MTLRYSLPLYLWVDALLALAEHMYVACYVSIRRHHSTCARVLVLVPGASWLYLDADVLLVLPPVFVLGTRFLLGADLRRH